MNKQYLISIAIGLTTAILFEFVVRDAVRVYINPKG